MNSRFLLYTVASLTAKASRRNLYFSVKMASPSGRKLLNMDNINPNVLTMEYAVRGPIVIRAAEIEKELAQGAKKPFKTVIKANIGDAHAMGQKPITFIREVLACLANPSLIEKGIYAEDVNEHARTILNACGGRSAGAYSQSNGIEIIRKHVAEYICRRDGGIPSNPENIVLSGGASESIRNILKLFINCKGKKPAGVMIPIPQYPLYSATVEEYGLGQVGYYLDEDNNWALSVKELKRALEANKDKYDVRVLCVINPGNPTGQVLSQQNIEEIIKFAYKHKLFLLADEVYQDNIYAEGCAFHSFKKVMTNLGEPYSKMELASFHSASKGYMGECGMRGGYVEVMNMCPEVFAQFKKMISAKLCSTVLGQAVMDCITNPPKPGDPSYKRWLEEKTATLKSLKERAKLVQKAFDSVDGVKCNPVQGAMYAFPQITMPPKAIEEAKASSLKIGKPADFYYAMKLVEETGVCIVPGSGFGQKAGTYHFRTTILPQPNVMKDMLQRFTAFHEKFLKEHS
uniref:alanine transaminase n=1 Tax=Syphacia muris TaxID=451379 RepID=A0A0N5AKG8_9BILA